MPRRRKKTKMVENANGVVVLEGDDLRKLLEKYVVKDDAHWWFKNWHAMGRKPDPTKYAQTNATYWAGGGRSPTAHRWVWMQLVGPIDDGKVLDHLCVFKGCVNPAHIEMVTGAENTGRGNHVRCVERGEGTRYGLPDGTTICIHDDRSTEGYELIAAPTDGAVARAAEKPPRLEKPEPRLSRYVSKKLWDPVAKTHGDPVWDELPERLPGQCEWLSDPIREVIVVCHEPVVGDGPSCAIHKGSAYFRKLRSRSDNVHDDS